MADSGTKTVTFTPADEVITDYASATGTVRVTITKAATHLSLKPSPATLPNGGTVTLVLSGLPAGGTASVTCSGGIIVTAGADNTWTAELPNSTADYTFTASYEGNDSYHGANATCRGGKGSGDPAESARR